MKYCAVVVLCLASLLTSAFAQSLSIDEHKRRLEVLSPVEQVRYLLDNQYAIYSADYDQGLVLMNEGLETAQQLDLVEEQGHFQLVLGVIHYLKGDYKNALPLYLRAYRLFDSLNSYSALARTCNELGVFYRKNKDTTKAFDYLNRAEQFANRAQDETQLATSYAHRAVLLDAMGDTEEAESLFRKVYDIGVAHNDSVGIGYALLDIASIALKKNDLKQALAYIDQSTAIRKALGDLQGVAVNLVNTGEAYYVVKDYRNAIRYFEDCLELAIRIGYTDLARYTFEQLAHTHVQINDYQNAFYYLERSKNYGDSLINVEKTRAIAEMEMRFDSERKEQKIALQQAELAEQKAEIEKTYTVIAALIVTVILLIIIFLLVRSRDRKQREMLIKEHEVSVREAYMFASIQSQENERKRFAQDLHDGLGQLISALRISLLTVNRDSSLEHRVAVVNRAEGLLNDMHREIRSIAFNLMPQTLVLHGLVPALREMGERVNQSGQMVIRVASFDLPERLSEVQEISLYRVIQEWINNIIKYATASVIEVQLVGHEQEITLTIEDNGKGFDPQRLESAPGNGWKNIRSRINLLHGFVEVDSQPGRLGTTLIVRVPTAERETTDVPAAIGQQ